MNGVISSPPLISVDCTDKLTEQLANLFRPVTLFLGKLPLLDLTTPGDRRASKTDRRDNPADEQRAENQHDRHAVSGLDDIDTIPATSLVVTY